MAKEDYVVDGCPKCKKPLTDSGWCSKCKEKINKSDRIDLQLDYILAETTSKGVKYQIPVGIVRVDEGQKIEDVPRFEGFMNER